MANTFEEKEKKPAASAEKQPVPPFDFETRMRELRELQVRDDGYPAAYLKLLSQNAFVRDRDGNRIVLSAENNPDNIDLTDSKAVCDYFRGKAGAEGLRISREADSPAFSVKPGDIFDFTVSKEPVSPTAAEYVAQHLEAKKKPLPPEPDFFDYVGHFFSKLFGGEGNKKVNDYQRVADENDAIVHYGLRRAGYLSEKTDGVRRWGRRAFVERYTDRVLHSGEMLGIGQEEARAMQDDPDRADAYLDEDGAEKMLASVALDDPFEVREKNELDFFDKAGLIRKAKENAPVAIIRRTKKTPEQRYQYYKGKLQEKLYSLYPGEEGREFADTLLDVLEAGKENDEVRNYIFSLNPDMLGILRSAYRNGQDIGDLVQRQAVPEFEETDLQRGFDRESKLSLNSSQSSL